MLRRIRHRARSRNLDFDLTVEDIVIPENCPVLGIPLVLGRTGTVGANDDSPRIDRFDNALGYVKGNIRVISTRANLLKRDATVDEVRRLLAYMEGRV